MVGAHRQNKLKRASIGTVQHLKRLLCADYHGNCRSRVGEANTTEQLVSLSHKQNNSPQPRPCYTDW